MVVELNSVLGIQNDSRKNIEVKVNVRFYCTDNCIQLDTNFTNGNWMLDIYGVCKVRA